LKEAAATLELRRALQATVENSITGVAQPIYGLKPALEFTLPVFLLPAEQFVSEQRRLLNWQFS
jgi:hypothetical protein